MTTINLYNQLAVVPLIIPFTFGDEPANPGDSNAVNCMVTKGDLPLTITWSMNGRIINDDVDGVNIVRMSARLSSLNIDSISASHRGVFQCIAINEAGIANHSTELLINGDFEDLFFLLLVTLLLLFQFR